ncbi:tol-pal system-associated acyl-CoA thioesterase [Oleomonas cavernae]|uniref:Tol-pal system-associated acyl-CoA thioesterase n=1 Tax=Oleomonas cavernae TaxID=2320859 RepID=A0A418VUD9_9PROT|nr:tol-pal system-associated acyl-CoA thioesterase [Oleomonas cavernae]RJF80755.1 tol-pal system-associated acyl-CoA thioesterase [Oleomonas cavernae]
MPDWATLTPQQGSLAEGAHWLPVRVFFEDTDAGGIVYHANYLKFMERARSDFARLIGIDQNAMMEGDDPLAFVVKRIDIDYARPARLDDALVVETRLKVLKGASMESVQIVRRGEEIMTQAQVRLACLDRNGRPRRFPDPVRHAFAPFETQNMPRDTGKHG